MVSSVLHLADTHFGTHLPQALQALSALARAQRPDVLVISGDVTHGGRASEFEAAQSFFRELDIRHVLAVAGNGDLPLFNLPRRLLAPCARFLETFGGLLEPRLALPGLRIAGLHTPRAWRHRVGQVSRTQAQDAAAWLQDGAPDTLRVVVTHHPAAVPDAQDQAECLRGGEQALQLWLNAGVHVVLGGHLHRPFLLPMDTLPPAATHRLWVAHAGTAASQRLRTPYPHSVQLLRRAAEGGWLLQRWEWPPEGGEFLPRAQIELATR